MAHTDTENVGVEEQVSDFEESEDEEYVDDESVGLIEQIYIEAELAETEEFGFRFSSIRETRIWKRIETYYGH